MENKLKEIKIIYVLLISFILAELVDLLLDQILGKSILHSFLQLALFIVLFIVTYRLFQKYSNKKIKKLLPEELMEILKIIKNEKNKGIMINQRKMRDILKITKPTLMKRVNALLELQYISFEKRGNNKYFILTEKGDLLIK
jgi:uncharacterized membrane protein